MTVEEEYYNVYLPQKWAQDYIERNIRSKITSEEYEFVGKFYMCKVIGEIKAEIEEERMGYPPSADYYKAISKALDIIDKYIGEGSDKE